MKGNQSNISFESIITHLPAHVYWLDRNNVYLGCNDLQAVFAGLKHRDEIIGKTNYDMPWRDQAEAFNLVNNTVMSTGKECSVEETIKHPNGMELTFVSKKIPLFDNDANIIGVLGVSIDITKQKETEKQLRVAKEKADIALENIITHLPGNVYWLDRNNVYLGCNTVQAISAGLKNRHEIVGKTNYDMPWRDQAEAFNMVNNKVINTGQEYSVEEIARQANGTELIFISKKVPLLDNRNNIIGTLGISFDITKQKEAENQLREAKEKAEAANNAKTAFLENMRHDIRTPLSGIVALSELLQQEKDSNKIGRYTATLAESSRELLRFLNEILESINVAAGEIPVLEKKFNLRTILENVIKLNKSKTEEKNLNLEFLFDEQIPKYLIGDPIRIYRIVLELLVNALKFTKEGYVKVSAKLAEKNGRNITLQIEIEDTGPGVPIEKQQELFIRFKRLTPSYQGIYKGTGLGLSIVKQFIHDLEGEIHYVESPNKGAKFICLFPVKQALLEDNVGEDNYNAISSYSSLLEAQTSKLETISKEPNMVPKENVCILVVEDQVIVANVIKELFTKLNCKVEIAEDGETAIHMVEERQYDLILMDIGLPDIDGYEVTKIIRSYKNNAQHQVPIVGLTAHIDSEKKKQGLEIGMNLVLTKPLTEEAAIIILENYTSHYATELSSPTIKMIK